ncbi:C40 family peptidase [Microbispora sp. H11081]|uniref:C40 family peptidase n=1 Tax=Microbispora sp. H11081 TaxID=2729107 RepID=UPI001B8D31DE|nr:C40 family peptidase [Microbispora sp. H11081]
MSGVALTAFAVAVPALPAAAAPGTTPEPQPVPPVPPQPVATETAQVTTPPATPPATTPVTAPTAAPITTPTTAPTAAPTTALAFRAARAARNAAANEKLAKSALQQEKAKRAIEVAKRQLGDPYVWGATGPSAFDCSGLVQFAWRKAGVKLPRTTWSMLGAVKKKVSLARLKPGDLVFTGGGGHVGIYIGNKKVINAPHSGAVVRVDSLKGYWKRGFLTAVRPGV